MYITYIVVLLIISLCYIISVLHHITYQTYDFLEKRARRAGGWGSRGQAVNKAPKGNGIGATGSKNPRAYQSPCFSLLGVVLRIWVLVLRPLCPYTVALRGVA